MEKEIIGYIKGLVRVLIILSIFIVTDVSGQCPDQDNTNKLDGQVEVDAFLANNPDCAYIDELELTGDINDISGFSSLKSVSYLYINECPNLTDLSGFSNIDSIFGNLGFYNTEGLVNLCGLSNLVSIGNDLRLEGTVSIENLDGLENLVMIGDDITIDENESLKSLNGLQNASLIEGSSISIKDNPLLTDCCGIQNMIENTPDLNLSIENTPSPCSTEQEIVNAFCTFSSSGCITNTYETYSFDVNIFPNPASTFLNVENFDSRSIEQLLIYNSYGQIVLQIDDSKSSVAIDFLSNGVYIVEVREGNTRQMEKIIVQKKK